MRKDKYEISLWEDYPVDATEEIPAHYEEQKIAVIGSNTMSDDCRAYDPKLVENINGTNTFTFKMYYTLTDEKGTKYTNPFINLLVNERKVKVLWKKKWYDLIIKDIQKNSSEKSIIYTCKDLFINELSKTGFDLEFDVELENNQGTAQELGARVLEGTDWQLKDAEATKFLQYKDEPVYEVITSVTFTAKNQTKNVDVSIPSGKKILVFYNPFINKDLNCQFLYNENGIYPRDINSQLVIETDCYNIKLSTWTGREAWAKIGGTSTKIFTLPTTLSDEYRGSRLIDSEKSIYDPLTKKYCTIITAQADSNEFYTNGSSLIQTYAEGDTIYRYATTEYNKDATSINNILINGKSFVDLNGWLTKNTVEMQLCPKNNIIAKNLISLEPDVNSYFYNSGLKDGQNYLPKEGFVKDSNYICRFRVRADAAGEPAPNYFTAPTGLKFHICRYELDSDGVPIPRSYMSDVDPDPEDSPHYFSQAAETGGSESIFWNPITEYFEIPMKCNVSASLQQIKNLLIGFFIEVPTGSKYWLEEIQFFPEVFGKKDIKEFVITRKYYQGDYCYLLENDEKTYYQAKVDIPSGSEFVSQQWQSVTIDPNSMRINPGELDTESVISIVYKYYNHTKSEDITDANLIYYLYSGEAPWLNNDLKIESNGFEKIRSITGKNSNRFNFLQSIAETFECWCRFEIEHDNTGRVIYVDGVPQKFVSFVEEVGEETGLGFIYGIDLKAITRSIQSDQIVTKTIVPQNSNEFGQNGFCTIARSVENPTRDTFILNFDYFLRMNLIDAGELQKDLYETTTGIGYYTLLHDINLELDSLADELVAKNKNLDQQKSYLILYTDLLTSTNEELEKVKSDLTSKYGYTEYTNEVLAKIESQGSDTDKARVNNIANLQTNIRLYMSYKDKLESTVKTLEEEIAMISDSREEKINDLKELHLKFYKKYSRYIQEGSWKSEDYTDDNLYYLDAQSVAYTSARPQISYNISVLRISGIEGFENKIFKIGDISYIQDKEFFGYQADKITPYKEKVLVSEVVSNFDAPENDSFKVQNYKTQFEDLFQRITSTTQSLQYASGEYNRVASIIETDGSIKPEVMQSSIALNNKLATSAANGTFTIDYSNGITVQNLDNLNEMTRITPGGIFITQDGGESWKNAIRGNGVATETLTTGNINADEINIFGKKDGFKTFRWDEKGINAFEVPTEEGRGINYGKFVRFDQYGIYGISNGTADYAPTSESAIWNDANFGLTWEGFFIKNKYNEDNHLVEISSTNDIQVVDTTNPSSPIARVKIGRIGEDTYGLRIADVSGAPVLETGSDGKLWLKKELNISNSGSAETSAYNIAIGYLNDTKPSTSIHEVMNANDKFIVYEDGSIIAESGEFTGEIHATSGTIGGNIITESGLTIVNGGFKIQGNNVFYTVIEGLTENDFNEDPTKYYIRSGETYIQCQPEDEFDDEETYYIATKEALLEYNFDKSGLNVKGNSTFTGTIHATSGEFTGEIHATSGEFNGTIDADNGFIGGWTIGENGLYSSNYTTDGSGEPTDGVALNANGNIYANRLTLGENAKIKKYLQLGTGSSAAYLYNPDYEESGGKLIEAGALNITSDGKMNLGELSFNGVNSTLSGDNWSIDPDFASFKNINASGKISTVVFETNHVQSVGGTMIFKPSFKIVESTVSSIEIEGVTYPTLVITLEDGEDISSVEQDNYVFLTADDGQIINNGAPLKVVDVEDEGAKVITVIFNRIESRKLVTLTDLGQLDSMVIGINSTDYPVGNNMLLKRGLTISEFYNGATGSEVEIKTTPRIFLGDLAASSAYIADYVTGYGLYADNVYLNGSLTTIVTNDSSVTYAGVNTTSSVRATVFGSEDSSPIVFWAGASSINAIPSAPFQVTEAGSLYANRGYFQGSVIANSKIVGARLEVPKIFGTGASESYGYDYENGLAFYDVQDGIVFATSTSASGPQYVVSGENGYIPTFSIGTDGFYKGSRSNGKAFIDLTGDSVNFTGTMITASNLMTESSLVMSENYLSRGMNRIKFITSDDSEGVNRIDFSIGSNEMQISAKRTDLNTNVIGFKSDVLFGESLQYKPASRGERGYDLFII